MRFQLRRVYTKLRRRSYSLRKGPQIIPLLMLASLFLFFVLSGYHLVLSSFDFDHSVAKSLLSRGIPGAGEFVIPTEQPFKLRSFVYALTNYDLQDPLNVVETTLPFVAGSAAELRVWEERPFVFIEGLSFAPEPIRPTPPSPSGQSAKVLIYHTHSSEMYTGGASAGAAHYQFRNLADPTVTGVMAVGRHLANALNRVGIAAVHEIKIHTLPTINHSYSNSEKTVREILSKERDFDLVLDLHRDAGVPNPTAQIEGRAVARLALVVGTAEGIPLAHPNYQQNLDFAYSLKSACDALYPGLMRPVQVQKEARYNQHLHPRSVIVELGSVENTLDEALLAAELLANVLVRVL